MKINISSIENQNAISELETSTASKIIGGGTLVEVNYQGIVNGYQPWQKIDLQTNSQDVSLDSQGKGIGTTNVAFKWSGGTGTR